MIRTQIYLSETEKTALSRVAAKTGLSQSDLIRRAIDSFIDREHGEDRGRVIKDVAGIWADRNDLPDLVNLRAGWNRR
ncbi:MAG: CopG family transcriptional regulator [Chitinispirillaceae bacterium]|nr:CopG family transcriptional regulator [Chitinispirillaceae bacterium]